MPRKGKRGAHSEKAEEAEEHKAEGHKEPNGEKAHKGEKRGKKEKKEQKRTKGNVRVKKKHVYIGGGAIVLIGLFFIASFVINQAVTDYQGGYPGDEPATGIRAGYTVQVDYVGKFEDGEVFDTSREEVAKEAGSYQELRTYEPLEINAGRGEVIGGFDNALIGMEVGEKKTVTILPADAYGEYNPELVAALERTQSVDRIIEVERFVSVSKEVFQEAFSKEPVTGEIIDYAPFKFKVGAVEELVHLENIVEVGEILTLPNADWDSSIVEIGDEKIKIRQDPKTGQEIQVELGVATVSLTDTEIVLRIDAEVGKAIFTPAGIATVIAENETHITMDSNHELAGKTLIFEIEIVGAEAPVLSGKPRVDAYVMSFCPYGTQAEEYIYPVQKLLGDKADFNIHFVIYDPSMYAGKESTYCIQDVCAMHGIPELNENMRQACIIKHEPEKLWDYLMCVKQTCSLGNIEQCWTDCAQKGGIDIQRTQLCQVEDGVALMRADRVLNIEKGVQGSPTIFINDDPYQGQRTSDSMKGEVCKYFGEVPAECFGALDTTAAAADGSCN